MRLDAFQKKTLRRLGAMHAALHEKTLGLSRGLSNRRADTLPEAQLEVIKRRKELADAEAFAAKSERYAGGDELRVIRERAADAETTVVDVLEEIAEIEVQHGAAAADSNQSRLVFEKLLKYAEGK